MTGEYLQALIQPYVQTRRVVIRMAYSRSLFQLVRAPNLNHVSYQRQSFSFRDFQSPYTAMLLEDMITRFMNSNEDFEWGDLVIYIMNDNAPIIRGAGGGGDGDGGEEELTSSNAGIFKIPRNAQNLCGFIAIICHLKKFESQLNGSYPILYNDIVNLHSKASRFDNWIRIMKNGTKLVNAARKFKEMLELNHLLVDNSMFALTQHGDAFVNAYPKFRIVVVDQNCKVIGDMCGEEYMQTHTDTESLMHEYCIALLFNNGHFDLITNLSIFWRKRYSKDARWHYCNLCLTPYSAFSQRKQLKHQHKCAEIVRCTDCLKPFTDSKELTIHLQDQQSIQCSKCDKVFKSDECFDYHARRCANGSQRVRCNNCHTYHLNIENHHCQDRLKKCLFCGVKVRDYDGHNCEPYIPKREPPQKVLTADKIWAFDIECKTVAVDGRENVHVPNLIVARKLTESQMYRFDNVNEFMEFLTEFQECVTFFAHNFGGYDGRVLFKYFVRHPQLKMIRAIPNGTKFMSYTFENGQTYMTDDGKQMPVEIKFKDSYRHMSQSLRSLPKTYGLDQNLFAKGFYPHSFNTDENRFYKGPLPERHLFHPDEMKDDEKEEFEKWYNQQLQEQQLYIDETGRTDFYDHYHEFVKYCDSDVNVLAEALTVYMEEYMDQCNGLNPLEKVTIASHCMNHYLTNHMQEKSIAQLKPLEFEFSREAFFGGRTHPCSLLVENSKIGYVDVNSLYPSVMVNCPLPTGPLKYIRFDRHLEKEELLQMHGILEVDIEPTKYLHHPIFPIRDPQTFTNSYPLQQLDKVKRTSIEIHKAIQNGYEVTMVYAALLTDVSYDLFKSYIYEAQTAKLLASGEPKEFETEEGRQKFIDDYKLEMGVDLEGKVFERNAGKRATAKLTNNSLWGKFGENTTRVTMQQFELIKNGEMQEDVALKYNHLLNQIFDGKMLFCQNFTYTQENQQITYMFTKEVNDGYNQDLADTTNVMMCAFVTANARMVLWDAMNLLGDRVLYCDTDSVIYLLDDDDDKNIKSSSKLGEWKDECEGNYITDFVSIAPKSYAYKMNNGETVVKCKGVTLNYENSKKVTFETMKDLVTGNTQKLTTRHLNFDCKKSNEFEINTMYRTKTTSLNKDMLKGELLMKDNEWNLNLPRDYMVFPTGFEQFIDQVQAIYNGRGRGRRE
jgi:hypothetical protein